MPSPADEEGNLWARVLDEVQSRSVSSFPQAAVLVLGDNESGKTTLIARLRNNEDPKKGAGLEYHYLDINPDYKDGSYAYQLGSTLPDVGPGESARLGVWILDGDPVHSSLIKFALQSAPLERCVVLLCASMTQPWAILDSLRTWSRILQDHVERSEYYDKNLMREAKERQVRFWQEYLEPLDSSTHSESGAKVPSMETDSSQILLPLGETTLVDNIGLPIVVVITKCDYMPTLEKEYDLKDEHFDFIQTHIRRFCLHYGAAAIYTSVKEGRNCDLLYKYLLHRIYGFPFTQAALVVDKDSVFIPAGWDNEKKIGILHENLINVKPSDSYSEVIPKPVLRRTVARDQELQADDEQQFLAKQQVILNSQAPPPAAAMPVTPSRTLQDSLNTSGSSVSKLSAISPNPNSPSPNKKAEPKLTNQPSSTASEGVLANFFNTLLTKKGGAAAPTTGGTKPADKVINNDTAAAAELDRILEQTQKLKQPVEEPRPSVQSS